jgi:hypothetical protein
LSTQRPHTMRFFVSLAALVALAACSFSASTAHLTDLKLSKDKDVSTSTTTFAPTDTVYAQTGVANSSGKVTFNWHFIAENVKGIPPNSLQKGNDVSNDLDADGTSTYTLSPPASGWPTGTYKVVIDLMIDGAQKEEKSAEFTVGS